MSEIKTTLYTITDSYINLLDLLDNEDIDTEYINNALSKIEEEFEIKAENIAKVLKELEGQKAIIKAEKDRLQAREKSISNNIDNLKSYLESEMIRIDKKKFKTDLFSFNIQKNPPSLMVENEDIIPEDFWITEKRLQKSELSKAVKDGLELDGVYFKQGESLRIR